MVITSHVLSGLEGDVAFTFNMFTPLVLIFCFQNSVAAKIAPTTLPRTKVNNCMELTLKTQGLALILPTPNSIKNGEFNYLLKAISFCQIPVLILNLTEPYYLKRWRSYTVLSTDNLTGLMTVSKFYQTKLVNNPDYARLQLIPPQTKQTNKTFCLTLFESAMVVKNGDLYSGINVEIITLLFKYLHIPYEFTTPKDGHTFGDENDMTGAIGQVIRGEAEMVVNTQILNLKRHLVSHFQTVLIKVCILSL